MKIRQKQAILIICWTVAVLTTIYGAKEDAFILVFIVPAILVSAPLVPMMSESKPVLRLIPLWGVWGLAIAYPMALRRDGYGDGSFATALLVVLLLFAAAVSIVRAGWAADEKRARDDQAAASPLDENGIAIKNVRPFHPDDTPLAKASDLETGVILFGALNMIIGAIGGGGLSAWKSEPRFVAALLLASVATGLALAVCAYKTMRLGGNGGVASLAMAALCFVPFAWLVCVVALLFELRNIRRAAGRERASVPASREEAPRFDAADRRPDAAKPERSMDRER